MDRPEFLALRDLSGKLIRSGIRLVQKEENRPFLVAEGIRIENSLGHDARLNIRYNPEIPSTTFNVTVVGVGPICRLDIQGRVHRTSGRTHKQFLLTSQCPRENLQEGHEPRPELEGKPVGTLFKAFCKIANVDHEGVFYPPDEDEVER